MKVIPYGRQSIDDSDIAAVIEVLRSDWITQGPAVERFEQVVAEYCGAPFASACCNATAGLYLAYRALGLSRGDTLWTSPNTFLATANAAVACGGAVDFVDIDPGSWNMSVAALERKLADASARGRLPKIVAPVHFAGEPCDMAAIRRLADRYGFAVVEDAAHAIGSRYRARAVGACEHSDAAVFSFHPVKIITTGEGGMVMTRRSDVHERVQLLRSHGMTRDPARMDRTPDGPWYYQLQEPGFNFRITDLQAALGASQLARIESFVQRRMLLADRYDRALRDLPVVLPRRDPGSRSALHLYVVWIDAARSMRSRREVFEALRAGGIGVNVHYIPVHTQPYYARSGFRPGDFPEAERYYAGAISLPMYADLSDDDQSRVIETLRRSLS